MPLYMMLLLKRHEKHFGERMKPWLSGSINHATGAFEAERLSFPTPDNGK